MSQRADTAKNEPVRIVPYEPSWPAAFEQERVLLERALGSSITGGIHHVGSTAVPGLPAKPIIDILVGIEDLASARTHIEPLTALDYVYAPHRPDVMLWFCKPSPAARTHHLHLVPRKKKCERRSAAVGRLRDATTLAHTRGGGTDSG